MTQSIRSCPNIIQEVLSKFIQPGGFGWDNFREPNCGRNPADLEEWAETLRWEKGGLGKNIKERETKWFVFEINFVHE